MTQQLWTAVDDYLNVRDARQLSPSVPVITGDSFYETSGLSQISVSDTGRSGD
jgi:hypothetical protein